MAPSGVLGLQGIKSTRISVLLKGNPSKGFNMKRGLRQGDPISLFLIVAGAMNTMMEEATTK